MPDNLHVRPQLWRELALQHDEVARETLAWAQPPTEWLADFPRTFGAIAEPVHKALLDYYDARFRAGKALADENAYTAAALRASADAIENADHEAGSMILASGEPFNDLPSAPGGGPTGPPSGPPSGPPDGGPPAGPVSVAGPISGDTPSGTPGTPTMPATTTMPGMPPQPDAAGGTAGQPGAVVTAGTPEHAPVTAATSPSPTMTTPVGMPAPLSGLVDDRALSTGATTPPPIGPMPLLGPTPFASAVQAAALRDTGTGHVVNDAENADLVLARTLLGAVLAATETSAVGVGWAVSVMRGPAGAAVFVTSDEGRGWLPAGLFLPREVSTPWVWDDLLGAEGSPWEGVSDPARMLVEFGRVWGPRDGAALSALASSGPIAANLRAALDAEATAGNVGPSTGVDLRMFTPDTTDRLGIGGSISALEQIATVPDAAVHGRCVELALDAHAQLGRAAGRTPEAAGARQLRERILARVEGGAAVPPEWWQELRDVDELLITAMLPHRLDADRIDLGELRFDEQSAGLRALTFERRCNELVLLLADEPSRQCLRDAVYAHEQIVGHPQFHETVPAVSATEYTRQTGASGVATVSSSAGAPPRVPGLRTGESDPS
ncbi:type VII secretion target [Nocardia brasiliensis]|uniref:type VII secretion target n=1 Tax=Nocardia brasiliensis TaxID=37326 RepID=UPI0024571B8A|nr:type VII secretion target [Nocardia brasiliensis]